MDNILSNEKVTTKAVILIDVEGFEFDVLLGAENILRSQDKPVIMLESGLTDHRSEGDLNLKFIEIFKFIIKTDMEFLVLRILILRLRKN